MLKHFGLREILFGIKKFLILIVCLILVFGSIGFISGNTSKQEIIETDKYEYLISQSYIFAAKPENSNQAQNISDSACASNAAAMMQADFSKKFVYEKLCEIYTDKEILDYTRVSKTAEDMDYTVMENCIEATVVSGSSIVNLTCVSGNEEFSKKIAENIDLYFSDILSKQIPNLQSYKFMGTTSTKGEVNDLEITLPSGFKRAVLFATLAGVLALCAVIAYVLFKPSVATKEDFESYNIPVLDDSSEHKVSDYEYAAHLVLKSIDVENINNIAIISTISRKPFVLKQNKLSEAINALQKHNFNIISLNQITSDFNKFKMIESCDAVIMVERKGETLHSIFENTLTLLQRQGIQVIGTVLI